MITTRALVRVPPPSQAPAAWLRGVVLVMTGLLLTLTQVTGARLGCLAGAAVASVALTAAGRRPGRPWWLAAEAAGLAVAGLLGGGDRSPLLPLLLGPACDAGLLSVAAAVGVVGSAAAGLSVAGLLAHPRPRLSVPLEWWLITGAVAAFSRLGKPPASLADRYAETAQLLDRLGDLTAELPTGLDPAGVAEGLLARCRDMASVTVGAVLLAGSDDRLVPLALSGATRVPWSRPLGQDGPLARAWLSGEPVRDRRSADPAAPPTHPAGTAPPLDALPVDAPPVDASPVDAPPVDGPPRHPEVRRQSRTASDLLVVPLASPRRRLGLLVLQHAAGDVYAPPVVAAIRELVAEAMPALEVALSFDDMRRRTVLEERQQVAREMHDGVAQDIAAIGFAVDLLRRSAQAVDPGLGAQAEQVRSLIDEVGTDIRMSMIDLRSGVSPERGLAAALTSHLRSVAAATGTRIHLDLADTGFRLPGRHEELAHRLAHHAVGMVVAAGVREVWVAVSIATPRASLRLDFIPPPGWRDRSVEQLVGRYPAEAPLTVHTERGPGGRMSVLLDVGPRTEQVAAGD